MPVPNGRGRDWTAKELALVRRWQAEGVPQSEQARRLGRTRDSLVRAITYYKLAGHPFALRGVDTRAKVLALLGAGLSTREVASAVGRDLSRVLQIVREEVARGAVVRRGRAYEVPYCAWRDG